MGARNCKLRYDYPDYVDQIWNKSEVYTSWRKKNIRTKLDTCYECIIYLFIYFVYEREFPPEYKHKERLCNNNKSTKKKRRNTDNFTQIST